MRRASLARIIKNDYLAFLCAVGGPIMLAIAIFGGIFGFVPRARFFGVNEVDPATVRIYFAIALVLTLALFSVLAQRFNRIERMVHKGEPTTARIVFVRFFRDRGRMEYEYEHGENVYRAGTAIMKNKDTRDFAPGQEIEVMIDPDNPGKAIPVALYTETRATQM